MTVQTILDLMSSLLKNDEFRDCILYYFICMAVHITIKYLDMDINYVIIYYCDVKYKYIIV